MRRYEPSKPSRERPLVSNAPLLPLANTRLEEKLCHEQGPTPIASEPPTIETNLTCDAAGHPPARGHLNDIRKPHPTRAFQSSAEGLQRPLAAFCKRGLGPVGCIPNIWRIREPGLVGKKPFTLSLMREQKRSDFSMSSVRTTRNPEHSMAPYRRFVKRSRP